MKELSKIRGLTINDIMICAFTTALGTVFKKNGESIERIKMAIPANIRFAFYPSRFKVKMENKFAAFPLSVPICESMDKSYKNIK